MTEQRLAEFFNLKVPIKDGVWWNGKPSTWSNLPKWNIATSQQFADTKLDYTQFGMDGHNGIDWCFRPGTPIVAPCKIWITYTDDTDTGYGYNVWGTSQKKYIDGKDYYLEMVFGHFQEIVAKPYRWYETGELLGYGDSTGFSTGHHLHFGIRPIVMEGLTGMHAFSNGYRNYIDPEPFLDTQVIWTHGELTNETMKFYKEKDSSAVYQKGDNGTYYPINSGDAFNRLYGAFDQHKIIEEDKLEPKGERLGLLI